MSTANNTKKYMDIVRSSDPLVRHAASRPAAPARPTPATPRSSATFIPGKSQTPSKSQTPGRPQPAKSPAPTKPHSSARLQSAKTPAPQQPAPRREKRPSILDKLPQRKSTSHSNVSVTKSTSRTGVVEHLGEIPREKAAPVRPTFINTAEVEKRPLGSVSRASILDDEPQRRYDPTTDPRRARAADPVRKPVKKKSFAIPLPVIVIITILLGIISGVGVYFLLSR